MKITHRLDDLIRIDLLLDEGHPTDRILNINTTDAVVVSMTGAVATERKPIVAVIEPVEIQVI